MANQLISSEIRQRFFKIIAQDKDFLMGPTGLSLLDRIWSLRDMPSLDSRYKDAYGDFRKHIVDNRDWTIEDLPLERLELLTVSDEIFF
jgi:hypothetical protein